MAGDIELLCGFLYVDTSVADDIRTSVASSVITAENSNDIIDIVCCKSTVYNLGDGISDGRSLALLLVE